MPEKPARIFRCCCLLHFGTETDREKSDYICSRASSFPSHEDHQTHFERQQSSIWLINNAATRSNSYKYGSSVAIR